ncbi:hypothetical protein, variant 2 [Aphanomyces astaci]|uniref:Uncharacterized protein n=1 Tax=Aphanomyces astaci TaxID=112090 RepID=W4H8Y7_APHAT|nr:hypothetical protein, variant 2 [Aphanomyces astaci]ETV88510.1 hypothetical protein, variant 2 [Aphanomyces astaci]|eukprot:XP_009820910.1 hypothetical protein, variant 2 [Aphanomyces astaci]
MPSMGIGGWQVVPSGAAPSANRTMESRRSIGGRPIRGDTSEAALSVDHPPVSRFDITTKRLVTNIIPGVLIFVASLLLVVLSVLTLLVLVSQGMFERLVVSVNAQSTKYYWAPYGQSCLLNKSGFIPSSCSSVELTVAPAAAWAAIGTVLAQQWTAEMREAGGVLRVTTCAVGGTSAVGWANLQFIAGYDYFPECLPSTPQDVAGMAVLETTVRDNHVEGLYFVTLYSDLDVTMTVATSTNSDGTTQNLMSNPKRTLVTGTGKIEKDDLGQDYIINAYPLSARYKVTGMCVTEIEELSKLRVDLHLSGWSRGKHSQLPVVPGWRCGHRVANANELMAIQIVLTLLTLCLLTGDIYVTLEGFRGLVTGEHVMTYNFVAGLERRKALLLCLILNSVPGVLYLDVARIYYFTSNGMQLWALSAVVTATCFSLGWLLVVSIVDLIPCRWHNRCVGYSAPLFLFTSIATVTAACCKNSAFETAANKFYAADPYLGLWINNATWPSGSYVATGTPVVLTYLVGEIVYPVVGSFAASILVMTVYRALQHHSLLIDTTWCRNNSFLRQANMPNFITSLPLEPSVAIRLGHDMYMRPSVHSVCVVRLPQSGLRPSWTATRFATASAASSRAT